MMKDYFKRLIVVAQTTYRDFKYNKKHALNREAGGYDVDFSTLRMYCHMLDKAMNNPNFERGHSLVIYNRAKTLQSKLSNVYRSDSAFLWVNRTLDRFERAQQTGIPEIEKNDVKHFSSDEQKMIEQFIKSRVFCRNFIEKTIPEVILNKIIALAVDAPNGCCRQTTHFYITQDKKKISSIAPNIAGLTNFTNIQGLIVVCANSSFYGIIDKNLQYVDASLAAENLILAAHLYGIYGTMCNIFHANENQIHNIKNILNISKSENIVLVIAFGYPAYLPEKPIRRNVESFYDVR